jgi:hypothetical protein
MSRKTDKELRYTPSMYHLGRTRRKKDKGRCYKRCGFHQSHNLYRKRFYDQVVYYEWMKGEVKVYYVISFVYCESR